MSRYREVEEGDRMLDLLQSPCIHCGQDALVVKGACIACTHCNVVLAVLTPVVKFEDLANGLQFWDLGLTTLFLKHSASQSEPAYATMMDKQKHHIPLPGGLLVVEQDNRLFAGRFSYN